MSSQLLRNGDSGCSVGEGCEAGCTRNGAADNYTDAGGTRGPPLRSRGTPSPAGRFTVWLNVDSPSVSRQPAEPTAVRSPDGIARRIGVGTSDACSGAGHPGGTEASPFGSASFKRARRGDTFASDGA